MDIATIQSVWTVIVLVLFVGIVVWAFDSRNKHAFDAAARIPLDDDDPEELSPASSKETHHG